jgi:hypothetical protein
MADPSAFDVLQEESKLRTRLFAARSIIRFVVIETRRRKYFCGHINTAVAKIFAQGGIHRKFIVRTIEEN